MLHRLGWYEGYFPSIIEGKKKVEVRLNDEKRRKLQVGTYEIYTPQQEMQWEALAITIKYLPKSNGG